VPTELQPRCDLSTVSIDEPEAEAGACDAKGTDVERRSPRERQRGCSLADQRAELEAVAAEARSDDDVGAGGVEVDDEVFVLQGGR